MTTTYVLKNIFTGVVAVSTLCGLCATLMFLHASISYVLKAVHRLFFDRYVRKHFVTCLKDFLIGCVAVTTCLSVAFLVLFLIGVIVHYGYNWAFPNGMSM